MKGPLVTLSDALGMVTSRVRILGSENVGLDQLSGRVLAADVTSRSDLPHFDNSSVDGYAVRSADTAGAEASPVELQCTGSIRAGHHPPLAIGEGQTVQVFTGGTLPEGADAVVMLEDVQRNGPMVKIFQPATKGQFIRFQGEEFKAGTVLLHAGTLASPPVVALAATSGLNRFEVFRIPRVGILTTGDEVMPPGHPLRPGQIHGSNAAGLTAGIEQLGLQPTTAIHVADDLQSISASLEELLESNDVVLTSGGVSVGDHDHVKEALKANGVEEVFWGVAIRPGQPIYFGVKGAKLVFGLPGNPVSAMVDYLHFVKPALMGMMGISCKAQVTAFLTQPLEKNVARAEFVRGVLLSRSGNNEVTPINARGSHMLGGLVAANCLIHFPLEKSRLEVGECVEVVKIDWGFPSFSGISES